MIVEDYLKNPQKILFKISAFGVIVGNILQIGIFICNYFCDDVDLDFYFINFYFLIPFLVLLVISILSSKLSFHNLVKTSFRRFFVISTEIPLNLITLTFGITFIIFCFKTKGCDKCHLNCDNTTINSMDNNVEQCHEKCNYTNDCFFKELQKEPLIKCIVIFVSIQCFFTIMLIISFIVMFCNLSDKEIRESKKERNYVIDYFRPPQKYFFIISLCTLVGITFAQFINSSIWVSKCDKSIAKKKKYDDYDITFDFKDYDPYAYHCNHINCNNPYLCPNIYNTTGDCINCSDFNHYFYYYMSCNDALTHCTFILNCTIDFIYSEKICVESERYIYVFVAAGCFQFVILFIILIVSQTCLKGRFFYKTLELQFARYTIFTIISLFYVLLAIFSIIVFKLTKADDKLRGQPKYNKERYSSLAFAIIQILAFVIFIIGIGYTQYNQSDIEILEDNAQLGQTLIDDSSFTN